MELQYQVDWLCTKRKREGSHTEEGDLKITARVQQVGMCALFREYHAERA